MRLFLAAALMLFGASGAPTPTPPGDLSDREHIVAAEYRRSVHSGPIVFGEKWEVHEGEALCGWVTSIDADGYITGWHAFAVFDARGPVVLLSRQPNSHLDMCQP